jgi:hypothetical protein
LLARVVIDRGEQQQCFHAPSSAESASDESEGAGIG